MIETKGTYRKYPYVIIFDEIFGFRCGYIGLSKTHKYYKTYYSDIDFDCHGGLTFSDFTSILGDDYWWIGFDCNHGTDGVDIEACKKYGCKDLQFVERMYEIKKEFRFMTMEDCIEECKSLIDQAIREEK